MKRVLNADDAIVFTLAPENRYKPVCVFLEDVPMGEIGRAQVSGLCKVATVISQLEYRGYAYLDVNTNRIIRDALDNQNHGNVRVLPNQTPGSVVLAELNVEPTVAGDVLWEPINTSGNDWASLSTGKCSISGGGLSSAWWGWRIVADSSATGAELIEFDRPGQYRFALRVTPGQNAAVNPWEAIVEAYEVAGRVRWIAEIVSSGVGIYHWTFSGPQNTDGGYHAEAICNVHEVGTQIGLRGQCSGGPNQGAIANKLSIELLSPYHLPPETHDEQDTNPWNLNQQAL